MSQGFDEVCRTNVAGKKKERSQSESRAEEKSAVTALLCLQLQTARFFLMLSKKTHSGRECGAALHK